MPIICQLETTAKSSHCHKLKVNIFLPLKCYILTCKGFFSKIQANIAYNNAIPENLVKRKATYMINFSHPIFSNLRNAYGLAAFSRKGGKGKQGQTLEIKVKMMNKMVVFKGTL